LKLLKHILVAILFLFLLNNCGNEKKQALKTAESQLNISIDTIKIFHKILPLKIELSGYFDYWKNTTLFSDDSSQVISILTEEGQHVDDHAQLLSLWQLQNSKEYTPVDIRAPFDGIIEKVFIKIGSRVGRNRALIHIYNDDYLSSTIPLKEGQVKYIKKGLKVVGSIPDFIFDGYIESVDYKRDMVQVLLKNKNFDPLELGKISVDVHCGNIKGDYIHSRHFNQLQKLMAYIDDESSFEIIQIGVSDSLSLIFPQLPHLSELRVLSHNNQDNI